MSEYEWKVLGDFGLILSVSDYPFFIKSIATDDMQFPNDFQQALTSERTPMLVGVLPSSEMLMTHWEKLAEDMPDLKHYIQAGLNSAYEYYTRMDETKAYVIAMCMFSQYHLFY